MIPSCAEGTMARARTPFLGWRPAGRRAPAVLAGVAAAAVVLVLVAGVEGGRREGRGGLPDVLMGPNGYQSPVQYPVYQVNSQAHQRFSTLRTIAEARLGDTAGFQQLDEEEETPEEPAGGEEEETPEEPAGGASARSAPAKPAPPWRGRAPSGAFGFGFVGGVSWLVIILTIVFLFFILATVCAKKDSWVRALAYTFVLTVLMVYMIWWHLVPEIQRFHDLVPADCLIAGAPVLVNYTYNRHMVVVAHIPVNVSNIVCHGETGHGMEMTDIQGMKHFDARNDVIFCSEGASLINGSTAYLKIDDWRWLDPDERQDAIGKYAEGESFFCWVDPTRPGFVTFTNDQDWSAIFYPLACIILIIFLCWAAGSCALCSACYYCCLIDPWCLRIDASTPVSDLNRRRKAMSGEYDHII